MGPRNRSAIGTHVERPTVEARRADITTALS
jgi:hypothetical protein